MFERLFLMLFPYITYSGDLHEKITQLQDFIEAEKREAVSEMREQNNQRVLSVLVALALTDEGVLSALESTHKIDAIKRLKALVGKDSHLIGLKQYKDAVEHPQVLATLKQRSDIQALREKLIGTPDCEQ